MAGRSKEPHNVVLGFVADSTLETDFVTSLLNVVAQRHDQIKGRVISTTGYAGRMDVGRHLVASAFLEATDGDYLVMVDPNTVFDVKNYDELVRSAVDASLVSIVSGLYAREDGTFCVFNQTPDGYAPTPADTLSRHKFYDADAVGLGFVCIPRAILESLKESVDSALPWFDNTADGPGHLDDATSFCWRATEAGFHVFVNTQVQVGRLKTVAMYPRMESQLKAVEKKLIVPGRAP